VDVTSHFNDQTRTAAGFIVTEYPVPRRCAAMYLPEANVLVPTSGRRVIVRLLFFVFGALSSPRVRDARTDSRPRPYLPGAAAR